MPSQDLIALVHPTGLGDVWSYSREVRILSGSSTQPCSGDPRSVVSGDLLGLLEDFWRNPGTRLNFLRRVRWSYPLQLESIGSAV